MLMDLKQVLKAGDSVPVTLVVEGADKKRETIQVKASVRVPATAAAPTPPHEHKH
jgi:copper(I)-binding protein